MIEPFPFNVEPRRVIARSLLAMIQAYEDRRKRISERNNYQEYERERLLFQENIYRTIDAQFQHYDAEINRMLQLLTERESLRMQYIVPAPPPQPVKRFSLFGWEIQLHKATKPRGSK